ncbi:MAG: YcxB family protein [Clostridiales bacterium]|jgi:hypothetical protein|nr:YcxB family protein [Clostridiales bacterium]
MAQRLKVFPAFYCKKLVKTNGGVNSVNITPEYFEATHPMIQGKFPWSHFLEFWIHDEFYFLVGRRKALRQMVHFLPKRCFSGNELQILENFARGGIKKVVRLKG